MTSVTCTASSRVGTRMSAPGRPSPGCIFSTIGIAKASVLPEPVGALASTSWPASAAGIVRVWIWKGDSIPWAVSTRTMSALSPIEAKVESGIGFFDSLIVIRDHLPSNHQLGVIRA